MDDGGDFGSAIGPVILRSIENAYWLLMSFYVAAALMVASATTTQLFVKETLKRKTMDNKAANKG